MELGKGGIAHDWFFLAMAHWKLDQKEQARTWYEQAVRWREKNAPQDEDLSRFRTEGAELLGVKETRMSDGLQTVHAGRTVCKAVLHTQRTWNQSGR